MGQVLSITRHRVPPADGDSFLEQARRALAVLGERPGFLSSRVGRSTDDPELWALTSEWESVGAYRRALSAYDVKVHAVPLLATAIDEPTAYELVEADGTRRAADAATIAIGRASGPDVPTDLVNRGESPGR